MPWNGQWRLFPEVSCFCSVATSPLLLRCSHCALLSFYPTQCVLKFLKVKQKEQKCLENFTNRRWSLCVGEVCSGLGSWVTSLSLLFDLTWPFVMGINTKLLPQRNQLVSLAVMPKLVAFWRNERRLTLSFIVVHGSFALSSFVVLFFREPDFSFTHHLYFLCKFFFSWCFLSVSSSFIVLWKFL